MQEERIKNQRKQQRNSKGTGAQSSVRKSPQRKANTAAEKAKVTSVVFGNGNPEQVLTGPLKESDLAPARAQTAPLSRIQAALQRGTRMYMRDKARAQAQLAGGKVQVTATVSGRRHTRTVHARSHLMRKLRIVRPGQPGYQQELRLAQQQQQAARAHRYAQRVIHEVCATRRRDGTYARTVRAVVAAPPPAPACATLDSRFSALQH